MSQGPVFLHRHSYRMRRLMDAIRLLPFLGILLCTVPLFWPRQSGPVDGAAEPAAMSTSLALQYLFLVWIALVVMSFLLWRFTRKPADQADETAEGTPD